MDGPVTAAAPVQLSRDAEFEGYVVARQGVHLRTAYLLTGDRQLAEDLVQTAFAKLYLAWNRVQNTGSLDAYVRRIMINEHSSWWRRAWRRSETVVDGIPEPRAPLDDHTSDLHRRDAMWAMVQKLPPRQRAAVVLRFYEDLSERQTAEILQCSVGTVKSQTSRAVAALRTAWQDEENQR